MPPDPLNSGTGATPDDADGFDASAYQQFGGKSPYTDGTPDFRPQMMPNLLWRDIGSSGLRQYGGWIREEFLRALQGRESARVFREMRDNNPTIGALMFAIHQTMRRIDWREEPPNDTGEQTKYTDFAHSLRYDMSSPWEDFVAEALSMLEFGFAPHEIVYKRRNGKKQPMTYDVRGKQMVAGADEGSSNYDDGLIGIRRIPLRGQETILRWYFDPNGQVTGMQQQPWQGPLIDIPIEKLLIFRPMHYKGNPEGRALDPETPIPTPDGWRKLDDIRPGSKVFDETGRPVDVVARADWFDRPCYEVEFGDGTKIVADAEHQWATRTLGEREAGEPARLRTTAEIAESLNGSSRKRYHSIEQTGPLQYSEKDLPLHPYYLGLWLGDGCAHCDEIACNAGDVEEIAALIRECGYNAEVGHLGRTGGNGRKVLVTGDRKHDDLCSVRVKLRKLGLKHNKHVPEVYLRGSIKQRRALLAGLMDSDGWINSDSHCYFANTNQNLAYGVVELVRSLGCKVTIRDYKRDETRKDIWLVSFTPPWSPFRLSKKASRVKDTHRSRDHYIRNIEKVDNRRTVCLEVNSSSHLFLISHSLVATHNSILRNCYRPYFFSKRIEEEEAILFERMNGIPVLHVPASLLESAALGGAAGATAAQTLAEYKKIITNIRIDEQMGVIIPSDTFEGPNGPTTVRRFELELLTPKGGGGHTVDSDKVLHRYSLDMLKTAMADFIDLGHQARGTQNLAVSKVDMFFQAISGWLTSMAVVMNRYMLPRVWALNGWSNDTVPQYVPDLAQRIDLDVIGNFILRLSQAGARMFPDDNLENYLREAAGMPDLDDEADYKPLQELVNPASQVVTQPGGAVGTTAGPRGASGVKKPGGSKVRGSPTGGAGPGGPFGKNNATAGGAVADAILYEVAKQQRRTRPAYRVQGERGRVRKKAA